MNMYKKLMYAAFTVVVFASCAGNETENVATEGPMLQSTPAPAAEPAFKDVDFASKKDLVCGMPITAGISDTAHYEGKIYGFCAAECKAEFVKSPAQYLVVAK